MKNFKNLLNVIIAFFVMIFIYVLYLILFASPVAAFVFMILWVLEKAAWQWIIVCMGSFLLAVTLIKLLDLLFGVEDKNNK